MSEAVSNTIEAIAATFAPTGDVVRLDVKDMTVAAFYEKIRGISPRATLWMPGLTDWIVVGARNGGFVSLAAAMDRFAALDTTLSFPELFASYAGTIEETLPALSGLDWKSVVTPANLVEKEVPALVWVKTDGLDDDIRRGTLAEIIMMQDMRRLVLEGNLVAAEAKDKEGEEKAIDLWSRAALRNPRDPMILERIDRLNRNAKGFLENGKLLQAMKCFETIFLIQPKNAAAIHNFGLCLKKMGKLDLAEKMLKRAEDLAK